MSSITTRSRVTSVRPPTDQAIGRQLSIYRSKLVAGSFVEPIPDRIREAMTARLTVLNAGMVAASQDFLEEQIASLMIAYPSMKSMSKLEAQVLVRKYVQVMSGLPTWAIEQACEDILQSAVVGVSPDFPPTAARLRLTANGHVSGVYREVQQLREVLQAASGLKMSAEERARIIKGFDELKRRLGGSPLP
jgi:hypothetical protein